MGKRKIARKTLSVFLAMAIVGISASFTVSAAEDNKFPDKISFESKETGNYVVGGDTVNTVVDKGATEGSKALKVEYPVAPWPGMNITPKNSDHWDIGTDGCITFDITNTMDRTQQIYVKLDEGNPIGSGNDTSVVYSVNPVAGKKSSFYISTGANAPELGMHIVPESDSGTAAVYSWGKKDINFHHITQITFWILTNTKDATLIYDNIRIASDPSSDLSYLNNVIDTYGQYTKGTWPGKVSSDDQLKKDATDEDKLLDSELKDIKKADKLSQYGGMKNDALKQKATGRFYTAKIDGKWTFVDPDGYPYIATGVDIVRMDDMLTWVSGRNGENGFNAFKDLPSKDSSLGDHYSKVENTVNPPFGLKSGDAFNFYSANLERKYGDDYLNKWKDTSIKRFKAWGFSTLGCWSEPSIYFGKGEQYKMPYIANGWINGNHKMLQNPARGGKLADPYDPEFRKDTVTMAESVKNYGVDSDKWCLGIYVDNEIEWGDAAQAAQHYSVVDYVFTTDAKQSDSYAKKAFIEILKNKYQSIDKLNAAWGTTIASFDELEAPYTGTVGDESMLLRALSDKYYSTVKEVLSQKLPNTLYLGSRIAEWGSSPEVVDSCSKYADVVSFNCYKTDVNQPWMYLGTFNKPVMIGEFHFNATDRGMFAPGFVPVKSQEARGESYKNYMQSVFSSKDFVGAQWFQYYDQPLLGRAWDGENTNAGFVDVADQPFTELVDAAREINSKSYDLKFDFKAVDKISLDKKNIELDNDNLTSTLKATVNPTDATKKDVTFTSSNKSVATVDENGVVTGLKTGYATIQAQSVSNPYAIATCSVKVVIKDLSADTSNFKTISFENGETNNINAQGGNALSTSEVITNSGVTDGSNAVKVTIAKKSGDDGNVSTYELYPQSGKTWSFGKNNKLALDLTNPNSFDIQIRVNLMDKNNNVKTFYSPVPSNSTKQVTFDAFDATGANYSVDPGYWGAAVDPENISMMAIMVWENDTSIDADTPISYIVDNIRLVKPKTYDFNKISFEDGENYNSACTGNGKATAAVTDEGVTDGTKAMKVTIAEKSGDDASASTFDLTPDSVFNFGDGNSLHFDVKNPNAFQIQARVNIRDTTGALRTFYYPVAANSSRNIDISNFGPSADVWGADGYYGANDNGLDTKNINLISFYTWEADATIPASTEYSFIVDNVYIKEAEKGPSVIPTAVSLDNESLSLTKTNNNAKINATVTPKEAEDKTVLFSTSNPLIATVDENGNIKACGNGTAYITASSKVTPLAAAVLKVTVSGFENPSFAKDPSPDKTAYEMVKAELAKAEPSNVMIPAVASDEFLDIGIKINLKNATAAQIDDLKNMSEEEFNSEIAKISSSLMSLNTTKISDKTKTAIDEAKKNLKADAVVFSLNFSGETGKFPVELSITNHKTSYPAGSYNVYRLDENSKLVSAGTATIDKNGTITLTILSDGDYVLSSEEIKAPEVKPDDKKPEVKPDDNKPVVKPLDEKPSESKETTKAETEKVKTPSTGTANSLVPISLLAVLCAAAFVFGKKKSL